MPALRRQLFEAYAGKQTECVCAVIKEYREVFLFHANEL